MVYNKNIMERTQIYLAKSQVKQLKELAQKKKTTLSELVRDAVDVQYEIGQPKIFPKQKKETVLDLANELNKIGFKGPKDLASNLDDYLYGGKK
jgi:hypothetical protein